VLQSANNGRRELQALAGIALLFMKHVPTLRDLYKAGKSEEAMFLASLELLLEVGNVAGLSYFDIMGIMASTQADMFSGSYVDTSFSFVNWKNSARYLFPRAVNLTNDNSNSAFV